MLHPADQGPAEGDGEDLQPAAHTEDGSPASAAAPDEGDLDLVAGAIDLRGACASPPYERVQVAAAGQDQGVDEVEETSCRQQPRLGPAARTPSTYHVGLPLTGSVPKGLDTTYSWARTPTTGTGQQSATSAVTPSATPVR